MWRTNARCWLAWGWLLAGLMGCVPVPMQVALPTVAAVAMVPTTTAVFQPTPTLLPTFTPSPQPTPTLLVPPTASSTAASSPTLQATATASATVETTAPTATETTVPATAEAITQPTPTRLVVLPERGLPPASVPCGGGGYIFQGRFPSQIAGPERRYTAYLPPCYSENGRSYPTLYLFHGSIQTESHWLDLGLARYLDEGIANGLYPPLIVIMPFNGNLGNISSGGSNSIEAVTVDELLPFVESHFCTWHDRAGRSLGGISRGGYWALMIAFRHTDLFTAVSGHSSHLRYETDSEKYNPLSTYAAADLSQMRIWLDWGETDFLRTGQQQLDALLTAAGIAHQTTVNDGGHNDGYWRLHLPEYLDWQTAVWPRDPAFYPPCS